MAPAFSFPRSLSRSNCNQTQTVNTLFNLQQGLVRKIHGEGNCKGLSVNVSNMSIQLNTSQYFQCRGLFLHTQEQINLLHICPLRSLSILYGRWLVFLNLTP
ncbi:hypothetical protein FKM82_018316 [Ascaphus truei]